MSFLNFLFFFEELNKSHENSLEDEKITFSKNLSLLETVINQNLFGRK
jgi:hypothetical protein